MPVIKKSSYKPPLFFKGAHIQTIFQSMVRRVKDVNYIRERINTPDEDFLDLDWSYNNSENAAVILHGMEGHSNRVYMLGMVKALDRRGWDSCAVNFRGCSGVTNNKLFTYHAGRSDDLDTVINHIIGLHKYKKIVLIGFSLGGNIILKYLGERKGINSIVKCAACTSVPLNLTASAWKLAEKSNSFYMNRFLKKFYQKLILKKEKFPDKIDLNGFERLKTFKDYDDRYTAPLNGFKNAEDYWEKSSSMQFLNNIKKPVLVISAANDPFLPPECYPYKEAENNPALFLEVPESGGHVGFITFKKEFWHEARICGFVNDYS